MNGLRYSGNESIIGRLGKHVRLSWRKSVYVVAKTKEQWHIIYLSRMHMKENSNKY